MLNLFPMLAGRLKALSVADLALDFEAQLVSRQADRKAELLLQADQHDRHGFPTVAAQLREQAEAIGLGRPLATVLPALEHWRDDDRDARPSSPIANPTDVLQPSTNGHGRVAKLPGGRRKTQ